MSKQVTTTEFQSDLKYWVNTKYLYTSENLTQQC